VIFFSDAACKPNVRIDLEKISLPDSDCPQQAPRKFFCRTIAHALPFSLLFAAFSADIVRSCLLLAGFYRPKKSAALRAAAGPCPAKQPKKAYCPAVRLKTLLQSPHAHSRLINLGTVPPVLRQPPGPAFASGSAKYVGAGFAELLPIATIGRTAP
jgi:hypothetical protein